MVVGAISPTNFLYKWNSKVTSCIATLSYATYLTHKGVIHIMHLLLADYKMNDKLMLIICMITCISFAYLLHLIIEKPFLKVRHRIVEPQKKYLGVHIEKKKTNYRIGNSGKSP